MSSGPSDQHTTFDLTDLSAVNYRRHRGWHYASATVGVGMAAGLIAFVESNLASAPPFLLESARLTLLGASVLVGAFCISLTWIPFRLLARPPIALTVSEAEVAFGLKEGAVVSYNWNDPLLWGEILVREGDPTVPAAARYRLTLGRRGGDLVFPWRRIAPLTYLTRDGIDQVLRAATHAHLKVTRVEHPGSLTLIRSHAAVAFTLSRSP